DGAALEGGRLVARLSNYCEIAPEPPRELAPGGRWTIDIAALDAPLRHWTDGATAGFVILADHSAVPTLTLPTRLAGSDRPPRRGTMPMPVPAEPPVPVSIIPWPRSVEVGG